MHPPRELYQIEQMVSQQVPVLRPAQALGRALWVYGTVLATSACLTAILVVLADLLPPATARQRRRAWLKAGADTARSGHAPVEVAACFPALLRWVIAWWTDSTTLPVAIDAVSHHDRVVALVISVRYRGGAIPVAWHIVPAHAVGAGVWHTHGRCRRAAYHA